MIWHRLRGLNTQERIVKQSGRWYRKLIAGQ
jgi:hypothetical protein